MGNNTLKSSASVLGRSFAYQSLSRVFQLMEFLNKLMPISHLNTPVRRRAFALNSNPLLVVAPMLSAIVLTSWYDNRGREDKRSSTFRFVAGYSVSSGPAPH